ncbi:hypothetical protein BJV78DRAFT_1168581 [Lactifluus subvellereus]|nr:hypothetical protein BJV78DRAFT_1168581 [Lactifluus subvellereus]
MGIRCVQSKTCISVYQREAVEYRVWGAMVLDHIIFNVASPDFFTVTLERSHARRSAPNRWPRCLTFTGEWTVAVAGSASVVILFFLSPSSSEPLGHLYVAFAVATASGGVGTSTRAAVACCAPRPCDVLQPPRQGTYGRVADSWKR